MLNSFGPVALNPYTVSAAYGFTQVCGFRAGKKEENVKFFCELQSNLRFFQKLFQYFWYNLRFFNTTCKIFNKIQNCFGKI